MPAVRTASRVQGWEPTAGTDDEVDLPLSFTNAPAERTGAQHLASTSDTAPRTSGSGRTHNAQPNHLPTPPTSRTSSPLAQPDTSASTARRTQRNRQRDPAWIPRPKNAFFQFRRVFAQNHKGSSSATSHPNGSAPKTLSKLAGESWRALSAAEQEQWRDLAEEERQEHARRYPGYRFRPRRRAGPSGGLGKRQREKQDKASEVEEARRAQFIASMVRGHRGSELATALRRWNEGDSERSDSVSPVPGSDAARPQISRSVTSPRFLAPQVPSRPSVPLMSASCPSTPGTNWHQQLSATRMHGDRHAQTSPLSYGPHHSPPGGVSGPNRTQGGQPLAGTAVAPHDSSYISSDPHFPNLFSDLHDSNVIPLTSSQSNSHSPYADPQERAVPNANAPTPQQLPVSLSPFSAIFSTLQSTNAHSSTVAAPEASNPSVLSFSHPPDVNNYECLTNAHMRAMTGLASPELELSESQLQPNERELEAYRLGAAHFNIGIGHGLDLDLGPGLDAAEGSTSEPITFNFERDHQNAAEVDQFELYFGDIFRQTDRPLFEGM